MNVAQLDDAESIQTRRQARNRNLDVSNPVFQALPKKTVGTHKDRQAAHQIAGVAEEFAARRIKSFAAARLAFGERAGGEQVRGLEDLYSHKSDKGNGQPELSASEDPRGYSVAGKKSGERGIEHGDSDETHAEKP